MSYRSPEDAGDLEETRTIETRSHHSSASDTDLKELCTALKVGFEQQHKDLVAFCSELRAVRSNEKKAHDAIQQDVQQLTEVAVQSGVQRIVDRFTLPPVPLAPPATYTVERRRRRRSRERDSESDSPSSSPERSPSPDRRHRDHSSSKQHRSRRDR